MSVSDELREIIASKPEDYVYKPETLSSTGGRLEPCIYFESDGNPSCIVGQWLHSKGYTDKNVYMNVGAFEVLTSTQFSKSGNETIQDEVGITIDEVMLLEKAQSRQDNGVPWSSIDV